MSRTTTNAPQPVAPGVRRNPREEGAQYLQLQVALVDTLTGAVGRSQLTRRFVAQDILRGRTASAARIGEAIADAAAHGAAPLQVLAAGESLAGWFRGLLPRPRATLRELWERQRATALTADHAQHRVLLSSDPSAVAVAVRETDCHLAATQLLRDALADRHAQLTARPFARAA